MANNHSQANVYNSSDLVPNLDYNPTSYSSPVYQERHLLSSQNLHTYSSCSGDGVMYSANLGENQGLRNQALGDALRSGEGDLSAVSSIENLDVPRQSIEQPTSHGQVANYSRATINNQSYMQTARVESKQRAGSSNSQTLLSRTPEPHLDKPESKKRKSSIAPQPTANKCRRTSNEDKPEDKQPIFANSSGLNTNTHSTPEEKLVGGAIDPSKSMEYKTQPASIGTQRLSTPTPNIATEKRKLDATPPSSNKRRINSYDKSPEQQSQDKGTELNDDVATNVVFVTSDQQPGAQYDQAAMVAKAREVGVHSTVALFRPPTEASRKYSRPPMSELYEKLQVTPDQFLHLQAAAKDYMLDPEHPERRDVIGKKSSIDLPSSNSAKIKLYRITSAFLWEEGWGDKCWGPSAPRSVPRDIDWPEAEPEVIGMMIPLMRRMVTNENQRLYAEEQRKARAPYTSGGGKREPNPEEILEKLKGQIYKPKKTQSPNIVSGSEKSTSPEPVGIKPQSGGTVASPKPKTLTEWDGMHFFINFIKDGRRAMPRVEFAVDNGEGFTHLSQHVDIIIDDEKTHKIKIFGPAGMVDVTDEASWRGVLIAIKEADWMDGDVRICVDVNT